MSRPLALGVAAIAAMGAIAVSAQVVTGGNAPDLSGYALTSQLPAPASVTPPSEVIGGATGTMTGQYALANHQHPRITRATIVTTIAGGTFSGTWAVPLTGTNVVDLNPISTGSQQITCELTAPATTTGFQGRCWTQGTVALNLSIVTAGINLGPSAVGAGVQVQAIAIPTTQ